MGTLRRTEVNGRLSVALSSLKREGTPDYAFSAIFRGNYLQ
jgi:hypothetical protein